MAKKPALSAQKQKVLTVPQAAAVLGISERATWQRLYRGMLPHRRWGKTVVIIEEELDQFLKMLPGPSLEDVTARVEAAAR